MAMERITQLYYLGASNTEFLPYYRGMKETSPVTLAFALLQRIGEGESGRRVHRRKKGGKTGLFEYAHHGTLFSDEIETMSPALQERWGDAMLLIDHLQRLPGIHFMLTARDRAFIRRSARASRNFGKPLMKRTRLCTEMPAGFLMNQVKGAELWRRPESIFGIGGSQPP